MRKEIKTGIWAIVIFAAFFWGLNFLKGKNLFTTTKQYYAVFDRIDGLQNSCPVMINGKAVGYVSDIGFMNHQVTRILVEVSIEKGFSIPANSVLEIYNTDFLGSKAVNLIYGSGPMAASGDTLQGRVKPDVFGAVADKIIPAAEQASSLLRSADTLLIALNQILDSEAQAHIRQIVANADTLVETGGTELSEMIRRLNRFSANLNAQNERITSIMSNLSNLTDTLSHAGLSQAVDSFTSSMDEIQQLIGQINQGKGSLGALVYSDSLYLSLQQSVQDLDRLLNAITENPSEFVHFSVFERKNKTKMREK